MQTDRMRDVFELILADFLQLLALGGELLINFNHLLRHDFVGVLRSSHQHEIRSRGQTFVTIRIRSNTQHHGFAPPFRLARFRHHPRLKPGSSRVNTGQFQLLAIVFGPELQQERHGAFRPFFR